MQIAHESTCTIHPGSRANPILATANQPLTHSQVHNIRSSSTPPFPSRCFQFDDIHATPIFVVVVVVFSSIIIHIYVIPSHPRLCPHEELSFTTTTKWGEKVVSSSLFFLFVTMYLATTNSGLFNNKAWKALDSFTRFYATPTAARGKWWEERLRTGE